MIKRQCNDSQKSFLEKQNIQICKILLIRASQPRRGAGWYESYWKVQLHIFRENSESTGLIRSSCAIWRHYSPCALSLNTRFQSIVCNFEGKGGLGIIDY